MQIMENNKAKITANQVAITSDQLIQQTSQKRSSVRFETYIFLHNLNTRGYKQIVY
jgi:hypothetical protein